MPQIKKAKNESAEQKQLRELQEERDKNKKFEYKPGSGSPDKPVKAKKKSNSFVRGVKGALRGARTVGQAALGKNMPSMQKIRTKRKRKEIEAKATKKNGAAYYGKGRRKTVDEQLKEEQNR